MGALSVLHERLKVIEYSDIYLIDTVGFITRIPKLMSREWIVIEPFEWPVWLMIIITFFLITIILHLISKQTIHDNNGEMLNWIKLFAILVDQRKSISISMIFLKKFL